MIKPIFGLLAEILIGLGAAGLLAFVFYPFKFWQQRALQKCGVIILLSVLTSAFFVSNATGWFTLYEPNKVIAIIEAVVSVTFGAAAIVWSVKIFTKKVG